MARRRARAACSLHYRQQQAAELALTSRTRRRRLTATELGVVEIEADAVVVEAPVSAAELQLQEVSRRHVRHGRRVRAAERVCNTIADEQSQYKYILYYTHTLVTVEFSTQHLSYPRKTKPESSD